MIGDLSLHPPPVWELQQYEDEETPQTNQLQDYREVPIRAGIQENLQGTEYLSTVRAIHKNGKNETQL